MPSRDPFNIRNSISVASIPCADCGHNMHCVRREPAGTGERQMFQCTSCGAMTDKIVNLQISDADVQRHAERMLGIAQK
jgi:uncharacterized Zn finger protein